ncbi:prepilin-type N-terminal cleavage/methylation domain-containing protein [Rheinheimera sp.]|uniref:type IV pilus modification PilV family protein n=1 Tax=Rheinheimera sp. TaxID=1869214 RepID=UPI0027B8E689|nr:prepilin-type N-terminal cleavage/methylation domain-containing protein [Rheinheimera sp.]
MLKLMLRPGLKRHSGFTLIELIVGMVVLAIAILMISQIMGPMLVRSTEPWHQVRAAELGHSLMNEIMALSFDENSSRGTNLLRCNETGASACIATLPACPATGLSAATEEASRDLYDDVDDFHCLNVDGASLVNVLNQSLAAHYKNYQVSVLVSYAGTEVGLANTAAKKISLTVTTPGGDLIAFAGYKGNW